MTRYDEAVEAGARAILHGATSGSFYAQGDWEAAGHEVQQSMLKASSDALDAALAVLDPLGAEGGKDHRTEAQDLIRVVKDYGDTTGYAVLAVAEAVLDLADALRDHQAPPEPVTPKPRPRPNAPADGCQCGHTRAMHHAGASLRDCGPCRAARCQCQDFMVAEPWPND